MAIGMATATPYLPQMAAKHMQRTFDDLHFQQDLLAYRQARDSGNLLATSQAMQRIESKTNVSNSSPAFLAGYDTYSIAFNADIAAVLGFELGGGSSDLKKPEQSSIEHAEFFSLTPS